MKVVIATENQAKVNGVKSAFKIVFPEKYNSIKFFEVKVDSNVKEQPTSEEEGIQGAINRAKNSIKLIGDSDFYIGLEGYVNTNIFGMFLAGASVVISADGQIGIGISSQMSLPDFMRKQINEGKELGPIIKDLMEDNNNTIRHTEGTMGILTNGLVKRVTEFESATVNALSKFITPDLYSKKNKLNRNTFY